MNQPIRWMAENHVAANLLMLFFIVGGLILGVTIKQEVFPEVTLDRVSVTVAYPGAGPEEVEEGILLKIEENLTGVDGIKRLRSSAAEGYGSVIAELYADADADRALRDIKSEVDRITTFPAEAEEPIVAKMLNRREVISVVVYGDLAERPLRERAERIRDELLGLEGITQVDLAGVRPYEVVVEVNENVLSRYHLTLDQLARRIREASLDLPGGTIKARGGDLLIRTKERRYTGRQYADLKILSAADGAEVRLGDIATVQDTFAETDEFALFDGKPAAMVKVYRVGNQKPTEISDAVKAYVAAQQAALPATVQLTTWNDNSELFKSRKNLLIKNALLGLVLVFITLGLFLEIRLALWVMLGIPISFCGALFFMPMLDASINMISLFAFIMALGIVVDDAIVIGENVYEKRQAGLPYLQAAQEGTIEVARPVIFAILTSVVAFMPLLYTGGIIGKFIKVIPVVVITILLVSLVEGLFVLPAHLSIGAPLQSSHGLFGAIARVRGAFGALLDRFINGPYVSFLQRCLRYRYATVAAAIVLLLLCTVGLTGSGIVKGTFMPEVDGDVISAGLVMAPGTPAAVTKQIQDRIVAEALATIRAVDSEHPGSRGAMRNIFALVGTSVTDRGPGGSFSATGGNLANISLFLAPSEEREVTANEISNRWRQAVGELPGAESLTFTSNLVHMGANIDVQMAHADFAVLDEAAERVKAALAEYPGIRDLTDNYTLGKHELKIHLRPEARTLGITEEDLGRQLRAAFYGAEALKVQRGRNEVKVIVRYPRSERNSRWNLETMRIHTPQGGEVPLLQAAEIETSRGFSKINRADRKRVINVQAMVDSSQVSAEDILAELKTTTLARLSADYPGLTFDLEGEGRERMESLGSMKRGFLLALFGIFALLAVSFRSYSQPLLVMTAIPFGFAGAILGHFIMGFNMSMLSTFGVVALAGVVVNDSLLLIDYVNRARGDGLDAAAAVQKAGQRRFRPILLTSLTTFFGLMPMIMETSVQAQFLIPMAISLGFGIMFATGITLLLIPSLYLVLEDVRGLFGLDGLHVKRTSAPSGE